MYEHEKNKYIWGSNFEGKLTNSSRTINLRIHRFRKDYLQQYISLWLGLVLHPAEHISARGVIQYCEIEWMVVCVFV